MTIRKATLYRNNGAELDLGNTSKTGKMHMLKMMQASGDEICEFLNDCGEFEFIWNTASKVWEFFNEAGELIGLAKFEVDNAANYQARIRRYNDQKSAYEAQQSI